MTLFVEDPFTRIVNIHFKDDDEPPPPDPDPAYLCGFFEKVGTNVRLTDADGNVVSYSNAMAPERGSGLFLGPNGITFNKPTMPESMFNVPMVRAYAFLIEWYENRTNDYIEPTDPPPDYGVTTTWTNFFDLTTWRQVKNTPVDAFRFSFDTFGFCYASMMYATGPLRLPPTPTSEFTGLGTGGPLNTLFNLSYLYDVVGKTGGMMTGDPFNIDQGGEGSFTILQLSHNELIHDLRDDVTLPPGTAWRNNIPNHTNQVPSIQRYTGFCRKPGEPWDPLHPELGMAPDTGRHANSPLVDLNKIRRGFSIEDSIIG